MKAISKGSLAGLLAHLDAGSTDHLAQQNLQISEHANNRNLHNWLFDACFFVRDRLTSGRPDAILVSPLPAKPKSPTSPQLHRMPRPRQPNGDVCRAQC